MKQPKKTAPTAKKPGRKSAKVRQHVSLSPLLNTAAEMFGRRTFGNKTAYLEHLILKDLQAQGLTIDDIDRLAEEYRAKNAP